MRVTILGCGTSGGVPRLGGTDGRGDWGAADPADARNRRSRCSILVEDQGKTVLVDTSPDVRTQLLDARVETVDAVIWTHEHADQVHGIDDLPSDSIFVIMTVHGQLCGIPVLSVRDIIVTQDMTRIPLAPPEIAGSMNLRGRIVTAIDLRRRLNLPPREPGQVGMSVVVDRQGELYSLVVDSVREVMECNDRQLEPNPPTLAAAWCDFSSGIYRLQSELLVVLNT